MVLPAVLVPNAKKDLMSHFADSTLTPCNVRRGHLSALRMLNFNVESTWFVHPHLYLQAGTYMYHSHHSQQSSGGLYGKFIVYDKDPSALPFKYDDELAVILNDWWHRTVIEQVWPPVDDVKFEIGQPAKGVGL